MLLVPWFRTLTPKFEGIQEELLDEMTKTHFQGSRPSLTVLDSLDSNLSIYTLNKHFLPHLSTPLQVICGLHSLPRNSPATKANHYLVEVKALE